MSQHFIVTFPFFTTFTFNPIVGTVSALVPVASTFNSVVLPEFSSPTNTTSSWRL